MKTTSQVIVQFIQVYLQAHGFSPTIREIATGCYLGTGTVVYHLGQLEDAGVIERESNKARSIRLMPPSIEGKSEN